MGGEWGESAYTIVTRYSLGGLRNLLWLDIIILFRKNPKPIY